MLFYQYVFTNVYCFKDVLKDPNINLTMEQIKLQCLGSVKPKDLSGTSKIKTKVGKLLHLNGNS